MNYDMKYCVFVTNHLNFSKYLVLLELVVGCDNNMNNSDMYMNEI